MKTKERALYSFFCSVLTSPGTCFVVMWLSGVPDRQKLLAGIVGTFLFLWALFFILISYFSEERDPEPQL
jgi:hypothetical protein